MIRKLNYTGRVRIKREDIHIKIFENGGELLFEADLKKVSDYGFDPKSLVFLEAYRQTNWMRFSFGTIDSLKPQTKLLLTDFDSAEGILFRLKVTSIDEYHKIVGSADAIPFEKQEIGPSPRESLLPVQPSNELGDLIYSLDYSQGSPKILINKYIGDYNVIAKSSVFISLVYPEILRRILTDILLKKENISDDPEDWQYKWLKFAKLHKGVGEINERDSDDDEKTEWIDSVIKVFAKNIKCKSKFEEYLAEEK